MTTLTPPAGGLKQLTWAQVEQLDARIRLLCAWTESNGNEVILPIVIRKGKPMRIGQPLLIEQFKPTAL